MEIPRGWGECAPPKPNKLGDDQKLFLAKHLVCFWGDVKAASAAIANAGPQSKVDSAALHSVFWGDIWALLGAAWVSAVGWLFTAFAISLGAPFWFDMLNKIMVIRSTVKPEEKSKTEGSKD